MHARSGVARLRSIPTTNHNTRLISTTDVQVASAAGAASSGRRAPPLVVNSATFWDRGKQSQPQGSGPHALAPAEWSPCQSICSTAGRVLTELYSSLLHGWMLVLRVATHATWPTCNHAALPATSLLLAAPIRVPQTSPSSYCEPCTLLSTAGGNHGCGLQPRVHALQCTYLGTPNV
jgi:hypothetical protein